MRYMLDTNICIYAINNRPGFKPQAELHDCAISAIVLGELELGVTRSRKVQQNRAELHRLLSVVPVLDVDADVAHRYGHLRGQMLSVGQPIGPNDFWIAAHALALELPLVTNNAREFSRVPDLVIETWIND